MAISLEIINVGVENQATGSDSLYTAFNKTQNNFAILSNAASQYTNILAGNGIATSASSANTITITNSGVLGIVAGTGITTTESNGNITISVSGSGNGNVVAGVTSVGLSSNTLTVANSPIISAGTLNVDLPVTGVTAGVYITPTVSVDDYGRITGIANNNVAGTVTSVAFTAGDGINISGSPITSTGTITVTNTGVTRINAGPGLFVSGGTGEITIGADYPNPGTVTSVAMTSNTLVITGGPITGTGTFNVELPESDNMTGNFTAGNLTSNNSLLVLGNANVVGTFTVGGTSSLSGNLTVLANSNVTGNLLVGGTFTSTGILTASANANVVGNLRINGNTTSIGTLTASANANVVGNLTVNANLTSIGTITGSGNVSVGGNLTVTSNITGNHATITNTFTAGNTILGNVSTFDVNVSNSVTVANTGYMILNTVTDNSKFVALQAPQSISANYIVWALPENDGSANSFMSTDGSGQLSFKQPVSSSAPLLANSPGVQGQLAFDSTHIYVCIATDTWVRGDLTTW